MNGPFLPLLALAAGVLSASSPCVLPVIPGFLAAVAERRPSATHASSGSPVIGAIGFVAGFTLVFSLLGATASALGNVIFRQLDLVIRFAGAFLVLLGLRTIGVLRFTALSGDRRVVGLDRVGTGPRRSVPLGAAFALGWTPCIGPVLAAILTKAASDASVAEGVMLLVLYSIGLGFPFVASALWLERSARSRRWLARRSGFIERSGGAVMVLVGLGYLSGSWTSLFAPVQRWLARTGWPPL